MHVHVGMGHLLHEVPRLGSGHRQHGEHGGHVLQCNGVVAGLVAGVIKLYFVRRGKTSLISAPAKFSGMSNISHLVELLDPPHMHYSA